MNFAHESQKLNHSDCALPTELPKNILAKAISKNAARYTFENVRFLSQVKLTP